MDVEVEKRGGEICDEHRRHRHARVQRRRGRWEREHDRAVAAEWRCMHVRRGRCCEVVRALNRQRRGRTVEIGGGGWPPPGGIWRGGPRHPCGGWGQRGGPREELA